MLDIHCHIIPGVDDGARDRDQALAMLGAARAAGVGSLVATPHVYGARPDFAGMRSGFAWLEQAAGRMDMAAHLGYEVSYKVLLQASMDDLRPLCMGHSHFLLLELPDAQPFPGWLDWIGRLNGGFTLIIAHPERCRYVQDDPGLAGHLIDLGCELQIDAQSLCAPLLSPLRRAAARLVRAGQAAYIASDAHEPGHYALLGRAVGRYVATGGLPAALGDGGWGAESL